MHCTTHSASHSVANTDTYFGAHHTGTHQPTSAFTTDASHGTAHTYTHTATNAATHGAYCALCWVVVALWRGLHQELHHH